MCRSLGVTNALFADVDGEPGYVENEEIQGRAALEYKLSLEEWVASQSIQQPQQKGDFFEHIRSEARRLERSWGEVL